MAASATPKTPHSRYTSGLLADPEVRKQRARNAILTRWQNHRLKKYLETVAAGEIYLPAYVQSSENKLLAKWSKIIQIVTEEALNKQPWAIKLAFQIRQEYFKDLERKNLQRSPKEEKPSIHVENALINMPIVAQTETNTSQNGRSSHTDTLLSDAESSKLLPHMELSSTEQNSFGTASPSTDLNKTNE